MDACDQVPSPAGGERPAEAPGAIAEASAPNGGDRPAEVVRDAPPPAVVCPAVRPGQLEFSILWYKRDRTIGIRQAAVRADALFQQLLDGDRFGAQTIGI